MCEDGWTDRLHPFLYSLILLILGGAGNNIFILSNEIKLFQVYGNSIPLVTCSLYLRRRMALHDSLGFAKEPQLLSPSTSRCSPILNIHCMAWSSFHMLGKQRSSTVTTKDIFWFCFPHFVYELKL